jgi:ribosomal protein S18 acetylase RimI-like enzyme
MRLRIRAARLSDLPYIYEICRLTGKNGKDSTESISDKYIIGQYFAAPYLHFEIDTCFVLENGSIPVGYILGTSSTKKFNDWMNTNWLPAVRMYYNSHMQSKSDFEQFLIDIINRDCTIPDYLSNYPSHLHIDLLATVQNKGYGKELLKKFIESVTLKQSTGIHLAVGLENKNAIDFYKRNEFKDIKNESGALFMGLNIK